MIGPEAMGLGEGAVCYNHPTSERVTRISYEYGLCCLPSAVLRISYRYSRGGRR